MTTDIEILETPPLNDIISKYINCYNQYYAISLEHFLSSLFSSTCDICWDKVCEQLCDAPSERPNAAGKTAEASLNSCNSIKIRLGCNTPRFKIHE